MTTATRPPAPAAPERTIDVVQPSLPRSFTLGLLGVAAALGVVAYLLLGNYVAAGAAVFFGYLVPLYIASRVRESKRKATDRFWTVVMTAAFVIAVTPLISLLITVISEGAARFDLEFFTSDMRGVVGEGGGALHAIIGTFMITLLAAAISIPVGIMTGIYLVEYGRGPLARGVTFLVDVMTGIPSIVAGLFAFALFAFLVGPQYRSGFLGSVALTVLMIPTVVRATEEMLKLVPNELREASYALGVQKWRTITKVVLPTALAGIITGVVLAIARVIGETAPLLLTAGFTTTVNWNPFEGRMTALPVFSYYQYVTPGFPPEPGFERSWTAALVLVIIVLGLNLFARFVAVRFAPKKS